MRVRCSGVGSRASAAANGNESRAAERKRMRRMAISFFTALVHQSADGYRGSLCDSRAGGGAVPGRNIAPDWRPGRSPLDQPVTAAAGPVAGQEYHEEAALASGSATRNSAGLTV